MTKRRRNIWDDQAYEVSNNPRMGHMSDLVEMDDAPVNTEFLEDAHEALSKLYNKTHKRAKQMKGVRRKDAWQ